MKFSKFAIAGIFAISSIPALAQTTATSNQNQVSSSQSNAQGGAGGAGGSGYGGSASADNLGNTQVINFNSPEVSRNVLDQTVNSTSTVNGTQTLNTVSSGGTNNVSRVINEGSSEQRVVYSGSQTIKNVPSMNAPPLTTSNDTCMGSTSGSAAGAGIGLSFGTTWTDVNCLRLKNARELWNMGVRAASLELLCSDENNRKAIEASWKTEEDFLCSTSRAERSQMQAAAAQAAKVAVAPTQGVVVARASSSSNQGCFTVAQAKRDPMWASANLNDPLVARRANVCTTAG